MYNYVYINTAAAAQHPGTYIEFKGLEGHAEPPRDRGVDPERLLDDTPCVLELLQGLHG